MATRGTLRTHLRRRLQEPTASNWSDATLNDYLNIGYQVAQEEVEVIDPERFLYVDTANVVKDQAFYAMPSNSKAPRRLRYKSSSGGDLMDIPERKLSDLLPVDFQTTRGRTDSSPVWARHGRYILIDPAPSQNVTDGLELTYVPALVMSSDADVPEVDLNLQYAIVLVAHLIALADTDNVEAVQTVRDELAMFVQRMPRHYETTHALRGGRTIAPADRLKYSAEDVV